ncbi:MAG: hypothetical protein SFZ02_11670 [bacterium]|nr:hypothetical protein [bacterium]
MNESNKSYALQTSLVILAVAFATLGCVLFQPVIGNVYSNIMPNLGGQSSPLPEDVAKTWFEALFRADGQALRDNMCQAQRSAITDDVVNNLESSLSGAGATMNTEGVTYSYNDSTNTVTLGGTISVTVSGQTVDVPMDTFPLGSLPMIQENGRWFVCLDINEPLG